MKVKVNIELDFSIGALTHCAWLPPVVIPVPVPMFSIEMLAIQAWEFGRWINKHNFSSNVTHKCQFIALDGHECGPMIPDITPFCFANAWYVIMWPFSKRQFKFFSSSVKMNGESVGCATLWLPMMTCGEPISAPTTPSIINMFCNTVSVNMSLLDFLIGMLDVVLSMAIDIILNKIFKGKNTPKFNIKQLFSKSLTKDYSKKILISQCLDKMVDQGLKKFLPRNAIKTGLMEVFSQAIPKNIEGWLKKGLNAGSDLLISNLKGNPTFKLDVGVPGLSYEIGRSKKDGFYTQKNVGRKQSKTYYIGEEQKKTTVSLSGKTISETSNHKSDVSNKEGKTHKD